MRDENMRKILSLTEKSEIRMKVHGDTCTYRFSEHPEKDGFEIYVVVNNKLQENMVYGLSCVDMDDVVLTLMQDYRDGIIEEVEYVKSLEYSLPQKENEAYYVHTCEENDGYNAKHEYKFSNKEEFLKFVRGEMAIDGYGNNCNRSYYEYIKEAYTKTDIDVITLYQMDIANDYNIDQGLEER